MLQIIVGALLLLLNRCFERSFSLKPGIAVPICDVENPVFLRML